MSRQPVIHKAKFVIVDPWTILHNGYVKIESGVIKEVGQGNNIDHSYVVDHGPGVIVPGFINAHTHLELSSLKGKLSFDKGFQDWVQNLLILRQAQTGESLVAGAKKGIQDLLLSGTVAIGEISTLGLTKKLFLKSFLAGVWFQEYLGQKQKIELFDNKKDKLKFFSFAAHAPHTTSPDFIIELKKMSKNICFSIHLAESKEELVFLTTAKGEWADFLNQRGIDFSNWGLPVNSCVNYIDQLGILDNKTIAVHLITADKKDLQILLDKQVNIAVCVRSNYNLHKAMPDLNYMLKIGIKPCLGTDSLASTQSLSMFDEMKFIATQFPAIPSENIFEMATLNGAKALGIENKLGALWPGMIASFTYIPIENATKTNIMDFIIHKEFKDKCMVVIKGISRIFHES